MTSLIEQLITKGRESATPPNLLLHYQWRLHFVRAYERGGYG